MKKKEVVLLMAALTEGGKTTLALALCHRDFRDQLSTLRSKRTGVTVDWTYDPNSSQIELMDILLNTRTVFGVSREDDVSCETFAQALAADEAQYLKRIFGLEKQEGLSPKELRQYVRERIKEYIGNCNKHALCELISNRESNKYLRRIKVSLPPVEAFKEFLRDRDIALVLRDTRGFLDMHTEEATEVPLRTMEDLGLDNIDAAILLGTSSPVPAAATWYKKAYKSAFESVPIFIMVRSDAVQPEYEYYLESTGSVDATAESVTDFLQAVRSGQIRGIPQGLYESAYRLLEAFEVGGFVRGKFTYNYEVYNNADLRYVYPFCVDLVGGNPQYDSAGYKLYEMIVFNNVKDMLCKTVEHMQFTEAITDQIMDDFAATLQRSDGVEMVPNYTTHSRQEVCNNILRGDILGPMDGIVTAANGRIYYIGAATSGVSTRVWLRNMIQRYEYPRKLTRADGTELLHNMPEKCQRNLIKIALFNCVEKSTDYQACFQNYYLMDRYLVRAAIEAVRAENDTTGDALDRTAKKIAEIVWPTDKRQS